jgi:hypothetical protein
MTGLRLSVLLAIFVNSLPQNKHRADYVFQHSGCPLWCEISNLSSVPVADIQKTGKQNSKRGLFTVYSATHSIGLFQRKKPGHIAMGNQFGSPRTQLRQPFLDEIGVFLQFAPATL